MQPRPSMAIRPVTPAVWESPNTRILEPPSGARVVGMVREDVIDRLSEPASDKLDDPVTLWAVVGWTVAIIMKMTVKGTI